MEKGLEENATQSGVVDRDTQANEESEEELYLEYDIEDDAETADSEIDDEDSEDNSTDEDEDEDLQEDSEEVVVEQPKRKAETPKQTAEENAKYASARREAEKKQKEAEAKYKALCRKYGLDEEDLGCLSNSDRLGIEEEGRAKGLDGTELDDYVDRIETREFRKRYEAKEAQAEVQAAAKAKAQADLNEFHAQYPDVDVDTLLKEPLFGVFKDAYLGKRPLVEIYETYLAKSGVKARVAAEKAERRAERATSTGRSGEKYVLTQAQARQLREWNAKYPEMKMSAKEFLKR